MFAAIIITVVDKHVKVHDIVCNSDKELLYGYKRYQRIQSLESGNLSSAYVDSAS
jgi:hypothetical protein